MVSYLRVSRKSQADSGLGLEAQRRAVAAHVESAGCELLAEYVEVETGKKHDLDNRPELRRAIAHAKRSKAVLVVAKLDRLLRSVVICSLLKTKGVPFVACDNPHANELTIDILAAVAANEVREIGKRTKAALAVRKGRGVKLGAARPDARQLTPEDRERGRARASVVIRALAREAYADIVPTIADLSRSGLSLRAIAAALDADGHTLRSGRPWNPVQVSRVLALAS